MIFGIKAPTARRSRQFSTINYCWPGRLHFLVKPGWNVYFTLWLFGRRFHFLNGYE